MEDVIDECRRCRIEIIHQSLPHDCVRHKNEELIEIVDDAKVGDNASDDDSLAATRNDVEQEVFFSEYLEGVDAPQDGLALVLVQVVVRRLPEAVGCEVCDELPRLVVFGCVVEHEWIAILTPFCELFLVFCECVYHSYCST